MAVLLAGSPPAAAQEDEVFPGPDPERPYTGYTRGDGTIVLDDESYCRLIMGAALGDEALTYVRLLDQSKKQKKARQAAFTADADADALARCTEALTAYRGAASEGSSDTPDPLTAWARRTAVVPAALVDLLPADLVAQPLALTDEIGPAARTSGHGDLVSTPFSMSPGPWLAELDAVTCTEWDGALRNARDPETSFPLQGTREYLYGIDGGYYYWDVTASDCDWSVDLAPVVLGPDPTPTPAPRAVVPALFGPEWRNYNPDWLNAAEAREAVLAAGLTTGTCHLEDGGRQNRVWKQEPVAGSLVEFGSAVDVWIASDCDVYDGDRIFLE